MTLERLEDGTWISIPATFEFAADGLHLVLAGEQPLLPGHYRITASDGWAVWEFDADESSPASEDRPPATPGASSIEPSPEAASGVEISEQYPPAGMPSQRARWPSDGSILHSKCQIPMLGKCDQLGFQC